MSTTTAAQDEEHFIDEPPAALTDETTLFSLVQAGDTDAFTQLYDRHLRSVYLYALSVTRAATPAEDATQEAWISFWKARGSITIGSSVLPWLLTTVRNKAIDAMRRQQPTVPLTVRDSDIVMNSDPAALVQGIELQSAVNEILASLSPKDAALYQLCVVEGHSYSYAANELGVSHGVARNRLFNTRKLLRKSLQDWRDH